eukprot:TRINITY_DN5511_c0_g1_i2.p1 TRINITY_DN5511_c0_g1~~TRINITY_DN5511_c0_g1_i2.p1  ORF type:complete len:500 (+),score=104.03 TRINITY_DN5511_c0_g1_i2:37-1536(+)
MPSSKGSEEKIEEVSSSGGSFGWMGGLMFVQALPKLTSFILNLVILKYVSPEEYGIASLQLPLIATVIPRITKEALHRAAVRKSDHREAILTMVWASIPIGIFISLVLGLSYLQLSSAADNSWVITGFWCWMVSSWIELIIEPIIIYLEANHKMKAIVLIECFSLLTQCVLMILSIFIWTPSALFQSYGQLIYALCLLCGYFSYVLFWSSIQTILPNKFQIDSESLSSILGFFVQAVGKWVTAEGEHLILLSFGTEEQQGVYQFVNNLGSIVARIAFQPIERTSFIHFSNLSTKNEERKKIWIVMMNLSMMISLLYLATCPNYIHFLFKNFYGDVWVKTGAAHLLAFYGIYLFLIGMNGLVESHRDAITPSSLLNRMAPFTIFSIVFHFVIEALLMHYMGAFGLICAACVSTVVRMMYSMINYRDYLFPITIGIPPIHLLGVYLTVFLFGFSTRLYFGDHLIHFGLGIVQGGLFLLWMVFVERRRLLSMFQLIKNKKQD